ncbi:MAG: hypothetical protein ACK5LJ_04625 [Paracoccus sp. (in: a-proteobacteria)]
MSAKAQAALRNAQDELQTRQQLVASGSNAVAQREIETLEQNTAAAEGAVTAAEVTRTAAHERLNTLPPAQKATAEASLRQTEIEIEKSTIRAGVTGRVEQFTLRPGDFISPILRSAGLLIPTEAGRRSVQAGFGQISAPVIKVGMIGEIACDSIPQQIIPVVVSDKQNYIATGQFAGGERLIDITSVARDGTVTVCFEPVYEGDFADIVPGSQCIANLYSNHHDEIVDPDTSATKGIALHAVDALGLVHAMLMRIQVAMMPFRTLVFSGGH